MPSRADAPRWKGRTAVGVLDKILRAGEGKVLRKLEGIVKAVNAAMRDGDWKLIEWYEDGALELYNVPQDIGEKTNLAAKEPERVATMRAKLAELLHNAAAPGQLADEAVPKRRKKK